ncbi:MAG: VanZ family protein, partial [Burkholderiales bacterium]
MNDRAATDSTPLRGTLSAVGLLYLLFVIYGSLVPLDFHPQPLSEAWHAFLNIRYLKLGIASRADWVANILLFVPLAFVWLGVLWNGKKTTLRVADSALVIVACVGLSVMIEFTQIFFPPRTVSVNDILAESIGAGIGIACWWAFGPAVVSWLAAWSTMRGAPDVFKRILYVYLFFLFGYNLLPLDLTISPAELFHKWRDGRIILIPFGFTFADRAHQLYGLISDIAIWVPVAFLWAISSKRNAFSIWVHVVLVAALLEFLQLFVFTRVSDVTQILLAAVGAGVGVGLGFKVKRRPLLDSDTTGRGFAGGGRVMWVFATFGWLVVLVVVF